jgi:serine/threonine protein kinase
MINLPNYQIISKIYESTNSLVYRGIQTKDNYPIIFKVLKENYPTPSNLAQYRQEYEMICSFNFDGVIKAYNLERYQNTLVILLEDFGGVSLKLLMTEKDFFSNNLEIILSIAIQITESLGNIHAANVIHKDINPTNIVFNPTTNQLKIIDFGISSHLPHENPTLRNLNRLEGTLAYMSPEQTGRMNRVLDYRTDFYALGITFYELLTNQLPFKTTDTMGLVHCHLAKQPVAPHLLNPNIPKMLSSIVMKLMEKTAENRYQNAYGIKADLLECLTQIQATKKIERFQLAQQDVYDKFQISQKLYGRTQEIETLLKTFERVCQGNSEVMLVSGYSGIGKTSLVQEIYKPVTRQKGYFTASKFDRLYHNVPYSAILKAFKELVKQLLTESEPRLNQWRGKFLNALGINAQVIIEVIPDIELIIGKQPSVPDLPPTEFQNRFNLVFQNFIKVFTQPEHPLVLFLDELEWADIASLKLMQLLITAKDNHYLFIIGGYRDKEVSTIHPLQLILNEIQQIGIPIQLMYLSPLKLPDVNQLVAETLNCPLTMTFLLSKLVFEKTQGNPFFVKEFFQSLYDEELVYLENGKWQWKLDKIQEREITDNVVELLADKIQRLHLKSQQMLQLAACIGNWFTIEILANISSISPKDIMICLRETMDESLILPVNRGTLSGKHSIPIIDIHESQPKNWHSNILRTEHYLIVAEYMFTHERIQQAAYSLIPSQSKKAIHLQVGQFLLKNTPFKQRTEKIFYIVKQLNLGLEFINDQKQRDELARLNLLAGQKAKAAAAYEAAFNYLKTGYDLLGKSGWLTQYDLTLTLAVDAAEAAYLSIKFDEMDKLIETVLQRAKSLFDTVKVYEIRIQAFKAQNKLQEAINLGFSILTLLGVRCPEKSNKLNLFFLVPKLCCGMLLWQQSVHTQK